MLARLTLVSALLASCAALGCTVEKPPITLPSDAGRDTGGRDANLARDGGEDAAMPIDAAVAGDAAMPIDAATIDAALTPDAGADAGSDAGSALPDAGRDAGADAGHDAGADAGTDAGHDAGATLPGVLNETSQAAEADFCNLQFPATTTASAGAPSELVFGQIFEAGRTDTTVGAAAPGILAELGYGPVGTDPRTSTAWSFHAASFNVETGFANNNDEYAARLTIPTAGTYAYTYRFSFDGGANVTYCDLDGAGSNGGLDFSASNLGSITVN